MAISFMCIKTGIKSLIFKQQYMLHPKWQSALDNNSVAWKV